MPRYRKYFIGKIAMVFTLGGLGQQTLLCCRGDSMIKMSSLEF